MLINDVFNKEELSALIIGELKELGVKYRKEKKQKVGQEKCTRKRIFRTHLHLLDLTDVVLANGGIVQIPLFVADACQRILEHIETEGLFRKAGSSLRQKEIRLSLEAGIQLGRAHHVIDVANVLKSFFRELPDPLLPPGIQEALLRSLLIGESRIRAIMMTCLLLPPLTINTLAFFMQFLNTVSLRADENKMSVENLAIIFTPGLMPVSDISGIRFNNHVNVVKILIENAEMIGVLPDRIVDKLHHSMVTPCKASTEFDKKKKKRRSGSLTRMFNGLKKIVGAIGSSENLENTPDIVPKVVATPCLTKSAKKRKANEAASAFSAKKKKEILGMLPDNGGILPNTPICAKYFKETKKRLSLGGRRHMKTPLINVQEQGPSMERRWSVVGAPWSRKRQPTEAHKTDPIRPLSPVVSMPCISHIPAHCEEALPDYSVGLLSCDENDKTSDSDYVRIPKSEYEAIKERVLAIETRISQEFNNVLDTPTSEIDMELSMSGPERVLNKFEKTVEETESMTSSPNTDQLAKRLSRELKIRRSGESRIMRSPSARKIGTIRRRSKENIRLSRNRTWHISSSKSGEEPESYVSAMAIYPKANLKRGRPNTLQTGLPAPATSTKDSTPNCSQTEDDMWMSGDVFFKDTPVGNSSRNHCTDISYEASPHLSPTSFPKQPVATPMVIAPKVAANEIKTPMLPPNSVPRRVGKTPASILRQAAKVPLTPAETAQNGRASIARLRAQNAGMVLAKAKLFDGMSVETGNAKPPSADLKRRNVMKDSYDKSDASKAIDQQRTPKRRNPAKSPGCVQKRQKFSISKCPNRNLLESIVSEGEMLSESKSVKTVAALKNANLQRLMNSPGRRTPKKRKTSKVNSPRHVNARTPRRQSAIYSRTPLKGNGPATRKSPRNTFNGGRKVS